LFAWETFEWNVPEGVKALAKGGAKGRTRAKEWEVRGGADSPGLPAGPSTRLLTGIALSR